MTPSNAVNGLKKSGIFPYNLLVILDYALPQVLSQMMRVKQMTQTEMQSQMLLKKSK